MRLAVRGLLGYLAVCCVLCIPACASAVADPLDRPASPVPFAAKSVLLDITQAGNRLVAVGERGIIVVSDDRGHSWHQAKVPVSVSLTAVKFATSRPGWAVGHAGVVLHTEDGGETWIRQLDGSLAAQLALRAAQAKAEQAPGNEAAKKQLDDAQRLVSDGADKPFLDLYFENDQVGFIVGAYGLMFRTEDGGKSWQPWMDRLDNPKGDHLYAIRVTGKTVYLAGERGLFLRSTDGGDKFTRLETPYKGTFFTMAVSGSGELVLAGMRGNAYWSGNQGKSFTKVEAPAPVTFAAAITLNNGNLLFVNQAGQVAISRDGGRTMTAVSTQPLPPTAAVTETGDGSLMTVGVAGAVSLPLGDAGTAAITGGRQ